MAMFRRGEDRSKKYVPKPAAAPKVVRKQRAVSSQLPILEIPRYGWLPTIRYVQIATHSRCNADCLCR